MSNQTLAQKPMGRLGDLRNCLGTRLTLTLLPLIIVPILAFGLAAYQCAPTQTREQPVGQLDPGASAQSDALAAWRRTHETRWRESSETLDPGNLLRRMLAGEQVWEMQ